ncbi:TPA: hypothetical protein JWK76_002494 [Escherichia coli]|uniref:hypothetical protein n=1 Tax=Escherichia coli TaxID=562 RepID=UPI0005B64E62|nr:hypothetical protein [Escherichia coli]EES3796576.1 hypothetical protein [Escherichia coli]EFC9842919.1 hypothetical protein [Escherichia coli]EFG2177023.1 hypothetical protein [Escherichia coli]EFJ5712534.1 hypothetical protein [Escherichia coli]EFK1930369.1 hypothetical protein [Escherichia coli]
MSVSGQDFINFAEKCLEFNDEIGFRNVVGRSYYGVYHEICSKLEHCYVLTSHEGVRNYLMSSTQCKKEPFDKAGLRRIGAFLHSLHVQRKWADYTLERELVKADAESALNTAKQVMAEIKALHEAVYPPQPAA